MALEPDVNATKNYLIRTGWLPVIDAAGV